MTGYNQYTIADFLKELGSEEAAQRLSLSQPYAEMILRHSSFQKPQHDR